MKDKISAHQHLSYTWLVGVYNLEIQNNNYIFPDSIGTIYHLTLCRPKENNIIKFIFYISLHFTTHDGNFTFDVEDVLKKITVEETKDIIYRSMIESVHIPTIGKILKSLAHIPLDLSKYKDTHETAIFTENINLLGNLDCFFYLDKRQIATKNINLTFVFENIIEGVIELYEIVPHILWEKQIFKFSTVDDTVHFNIIINDVNCLEYVIKFNCTTNGIGKIKNIIYN